MKILPEDIKLVFHETVNMKSSHFVAISLLIV